MVIVGLSWHFQHNQFLSIDGCGHTVHEVFEVLPCKAPVLRQHNPQVGTLAHPLGFFI